MTHRHYHAPPPPTTARARCPVCREAVYSPAGIHPQCAVKQNDPPRPKPKPSKPPGPGEAGDADHAEAEPSGVETTG